MRRRDKKTKSLSGSGDRPTDKLRDGEASCGLFMHVTSGSGSHLSIEFEFFFLNRSILSLSVFHTSSIVKYNHF
jgi:hypothetical protein